MHSSDGHRYFVPVALRRTSRTSTSSTRPGQGAAIALASEPLALVGE